MIASNKLREMAEALLSKSRAGQVSWTFLRPASVGNRESYEVALPKASILLRYDSPEAEHDSIELDFVNTKGDIVATWGASELDSEWPLLHALFWEAKRCVTHWDEVLNEVADFLGVRADPIGAPSVSANK